MTPTQEAAERVARALGISRTDARRLVLDERILHRWCEGECGSSNTVFSWCIGRDEESGKPFREVHPNTGPSFREPIRDWESAALRRVSAFCKANGLHYYYQTDPRGCALYLSREPLTASDYTRGVAVC